MIEKLPSVSFPVQLEHTDEIPAARDPGTLTDPEPTAKSGVQKTGFSRDETLLKEEALCNAVVEIEALRKTAALAANARSEEEQRIRSEIEGLRRTQEKRIEEAHSLRRATQGPCLEQDSQYFSVGVPQPVGGESEHAQVQSDSGVSEVIQSVSISGSTEREVDYTSTPNQPPGIEGDFRREDVTGIPTSGKSLEIPDEVMRSLKSDSSSQRSVGLSELARLGGENAFQLIGRAFDEESEDVRNAAALALFDFHPDRAATFSRTLREGSPERCRRIGAALASSGLAGIAIGDLAGQTREKGFEAFSLLFLMTKAGEVQPLLQALEDHPSVAIRLAVVKLLALNGQAEIIPSFRQLAVRGHLPSEVRAAVIEAIYEIGRQIPRELPQAQTSG